MIVKKNWHGTHLTFKEFAKQVWQQINEDRVTSQAAELSFFFLLALFPFLLFLASLLGLFLQSDAILHQMLQKYLITVAPESVSDLIDGVLHEVSSSSSGGTLSFGLLFSLWTASNGMVATIDALNIAYDIPEGRRWWKKRLVALLLTVVYLGLALMVLLLLIYGPRLVAWATNYLGYGRLFTVGWTVFEWILALTLIVMAFNIIYIYAPNVKHRRWHWLMPGTVAGIGLWLLVSFGFKLYLLFFDRYSVTYGSIGAVIILLLWFYFTGIALLVGAEVNSLIERSSGQAAQPKEQEKD